MPTDRPGEAHIDDLRSAFKRGRVTVSCGPFLELRSGAAEIGDEIAPGRVSLSVRVEAPSWMPLDRLELVSNGQVVASRSLSSARGAVRFDDDIELTLSTGYVIARVSGDAALGPWGQEGLPWAITNPIWVSTGP